MSSLQQVSSSSAGEVRLKPAHVEAFRSSQATSKRDLLTLALGGELPLQASNTCACAAALEAVLHWSNSWAR